MNIYHCQIRVGLQHRSWLILDRYLSYLYHHSCSSPILDCLETLLLVRTLSNRWQWNRGYILRNHQICVLCSWILDNGSILVLVRSFILLVCILQTSKCCSCFNPISSFELQKELNEIRYSFWNHGFFEANCHGFEGILLSLMGCFHHGSRKKER